MLILLPPSEGKTRPTSGPRLDLKTIQPGCEELFDARGRALQALQTASARADALDVLGVGQRIAPEVEANTHLLDAHCAPAREVYSGVLYEAGRIGEHPLSEDTRLQVVVQSALFGVVDIDAPIPAYRLAMGVKLPDLGALAPWWRPHLKPVMDALAAQHEVVVDARSGAYQKAWPGDPSLADIITVTAVREAQGKRRVVSHAAKHYRGLLAGALMEREADTQNSFDYLLATARTLIGGEVRDVEVDESLTGLNLTIVTG